MLMRTLGGAAFTTWVAEPVLRNHLTSHIVMSQSRNIFVTAGLKFKSSLNICIWDGCYLQASPRAVQKKFPGRIHSQGLSASTSAAVAVEDPQMVDIAARFVQEIIEKARNEATAKMNSETLVKLSLLKNYLYDEFHFQELLGLSERSNERIL